jgi:hypothetical protein
VVTILFLKSSGLFVHILGFGGGGGPIQESGGWGSLWSGSGGIKASMGYNTLTGSQGVRRTDSLMEIHYV